MDTKGGIFGELRKIQKEFGGYIPEVELYRLAAALEQGQFVKGEPVRGVCDVYSVASFYPEFRYEKPAKVEIKVCTALPCFLKGAEKVFRGVRATAAKTPDVEVGRCPCLGRCDTAPALTVNGHVFSDTEPDALMELMRAYIAWVKAPKAAAERTDDPVAPKREIPPPHGHHLHKLTGPPKVGEHGAAIPPDRVYRTDPYSTSDEHYGALRQLLGDRSFESLGGEIKAANLRGMGGAGKPFLRKFDQVRLAESSEKFVVANADESEPGTIKDREIMRRFPHLLVEALAIAGLAVGAGKGYIYLRHEYEIQAKALQREIRWAYAKTYIDAEGVERPKEPFLGQNILGSGRSFDLELFISPGGYVMGEQSALLQAIEGQRGQPRNGIFDLGDKKGLPTGAGLWGNPTLVSNVETFTYLPAIVLKGGDWFAAQGVNGCQGLKWASVCGDVERPCVREISMGTTFRQMIFDEAGGVTGGRAIKAFAPTGPSFGFLPATDEFLDLPMDFPSDPREPKNPVARAGTTVGSGAIIVLAEGRSMLDAALNFTRFFRNESCGKCVPCRVGSQKMVDVIKEMRSETYTARRNEIATRKARQDGSLEQFVAQLRLGHEETVGRLTTVLDMMSICGLGRVVHIPIQTVLKYWPGEIDTHLRGEWVEEPEAPRLAGSRISLPVAGVEED